MLATAACGKEPAEAEARVEAPAKAVVDVVRVAEGRESGAIRATGLVAWKRETALGFGAVGEIEQISADIGDRVSAGQRLAVLRRVAVGVDTQEAELARKTAQQTFERTQRLHASGAASQADLDAATLALERTRQSVVLTAPTSGVILRRQAERGQMINAAQPILWIGEFNSGLIVRAQATSSEAASVKVGDAADVNVRGREAMTGKVIRIASQSVGQTGVFEIEVAIDKPGDLRSGEVADVLLHGQAKAAGEARGFLIPAIALTDARADQGMVYVVGPDGKVARRAVETGGVTNEGVVILKGLAPGDEVITRGAAMVREGDTVTVGNR